MIRQHFSSIPKLLFKNKRKLLGNLTIDGYTLSHLDSYKKIKQIFDKNDGVNENVDTNV